MPLADEFLRKPASTDPAGVTADARYPLVIEPRVCAPPDIVVYEFGARLDASCRAAASEQIDKAQRLYNTVIGCIRDVHNQMNAWVLERAGLHAQALQAQFAACEQEIASARAANEFERLRLLSPQRVAIGAELTSLLRPVRDRHRAEIRALFFARVGNTTNTETYQLRCRAVDEASAGRPRQKCWTAPSWPGRNPSHLGARHASGRTCHQCQAGSPSHCRQGPLEPSACAAAC